MKKTMYIPRGQTCEYDSLTCERVVVNGFLKVAGEITAKNIQGSGIIAANMIKADTLVCDNLTVGNVVVDQLMAKRVSAVEIHAISSLSVSSYIEAGYVKTPKAMIAEAEIEDMDAGEIIKLKPKERSLWAMLISSQLNSLWVWLLCAMKNKFEDLSENVTCETPVADDADDSSADKSSAHYDEVAELLQNPEFHQFVKAFRAIKNGETIHIPRADEEVSPGVLQERVHQFTAAGADMKDAA
jgi:hypothetical protein